MKVLSLDKALAEFVKTAGGETIPESTESRRADFLFRKQNVVAELKTLKEEARQEHARKLQTLVNDWMRRRLLRIYGRVAIELQKVHPICQQEWLDILQPPVERIVGAANRQIRSTKNDLQVTSAKGLLLIANEGNLLYTTPADYLAVVSRVLQKRTQNGKARFSEINAVVYISFDMTRNGLIPQWRAGFVDMADHQLRDFVNTLQHQWFTFLSHLRIA